MQLHDKVVVITGSGGGVGEACARRFTAEGARVVVTDVDAAGVERVAAAIGSVGLAADITEEENVRAVADLARRTYGRIDVWFSNAGIAGPPQPGDIQANAMWESMWALHVMAHVHAVREVLPEMLRRGDGYLVQTASALAVAPYVPKAAYSVTKHAALALAEWLAAAYGPQGIKVSCFCPGAMLTPMLLAEGFPPDHPTMQHATKPEDVADRLVRAIDAEQFFVVDSNTAADALLAKGADYDGWISDVASRSR